MRFRLVQRLKSETVADWTPGIWSPLRLQIWFRPKTFGDEDVKKRTPHIVSSSAIQCNLDEEVYSLSHRFHN
ncbi:hypothetical protein J6590_103975 [Homalodisca vitripennis]|nr:hypothetical protein J6590_103975 [Homalodisca vitripennis]